MKSLVILFIILVSSGCSSVDVRQYSENQPQLNLREYFTGETKGWGIVQDRSGKLTRQFVVSINGYVDKDGSLVLEEDFNWNDGEKSHRTWTITAQDDHTYTGKAADVVGAAQGERYGNVLNWKYQLNLEVEGVVWKVRFDDWMFLQPDNVLINRASMSKFGFRLGEVTIVFNKMES